MKHDLRQSGPFIAIGGMAVALFLYGYIAIAFPSVLHTVLMPAVWLVLFVVSCRWFTPRPRAAVLLPVLAIVLWFAAVLVFGRNG